MLSPPAVTAAALSLRERRLLALEGNVAATHDTLAKILETMLDVPLVVFHTPIERKARVRVDDGMLLIHVLVEASSWP